MAALIIKVHSIEGNCVVHEVGDEINICMPRVVLEKTDNICIHALAPLLHYATALNQGVDPVKLGLAKEGNKAFIACPDPGEPHTCGARVVFSMEKIEE